MVTGSDAEREQGIQDYLQLISAGGSDHPIALLQAAGVDMTDPAALRALPAEMGRLVDQLANEVESSETLR